MNAKNGSRAGIAAPLALLILMLGGAAHGADCNGNGVEDAIDIANGTSQDCNNNNRPDECDIDDGLATDCNLNGVPDVCDVASGTSGDCNGNEWPDECEDCNENGVADDCDIDSGEFPDCNNNGVIDVCEIAWGIAQDCNGNLIPDQCELLQGLADDCNNNGKLDECDIANGISQDCDLNGVPDECQPDCNDNGIADPCDIDDGTSTDCDQNGVPDECQSGTSDCNVNGIPDMCDVFNGTSPDCNGNLVPDECEAVPFEATSPVFSPIGFGQPRTWNIPASPEPGTNVLLSFAAVGDFGSAVEFITVKVNGTVVGTIYDDSGADCSASPLLDDVIVPKETWAQLVPNGTAAIRMEASSAVDPTPALCTSWIQAEIFFQPISVGDCNGNGEPDECDIDNGTSQDVNDNGVPDECEGVICPADLDGSGAVDFGDILRVLSAWGACSGCPEDLDDSGDVGFNDLLVILSDFGPC